MSDAEEYEADVFCLRKEEPARLGESCRLYEKKFNFKGSLASLQL